MGLMSRSLLLFDGYRLFYVGALSDERTGLPFARVTVSSSKSVVPTIYILHVIKRLYIDMYVCMYI
jgi:hypothetical protein